MIDWFIENKEWAFSGFAIALPLFIVGLFFSKGKKAFSQKSGDNSFNLQANGDIKLKKKK
ncbi:hypothetical protein [Klebsiella variicola]|uniref:hypothetical protein n=1 Tax=Klebsiella variicola TaxID=244366 RepID=UPI001CF6FB49|nr:hypothetical protein [Klebsiella variicola]MCB3547263.1 hypothetical protein [Klebsiella pneumoniae]HDU4473419.1 hypothetical protein [Klebsiella pneumoniae subsp. pneumoniae]MCB3551617.1 hypothetical protein [Klebsiella pneumoniae]MCP5769837.1 hypothetical protein [Klebsiella pneumoniae]HBT1520679.1 hypothetical protein [Klebsiella pneumoniae]